jgi:hypothetical protein
MKQPFGWFHAAKYNYFLPAFEDISAARIPAQSGEVVMRSLLLGSIGE